MTISKKRVLIDTNFVTDFAEKVPKELENAEFYLSVLGMIELLHEGFVHKRKLINKFIQKENVHVMKHIWPFQDEVTRYPLKVDVDNMLLPLEAKSVEELLESKNLRDSLSQIPTFEKGFKKNVTSMLDAIGDKNFVTIEDYRKYLLSLLPRVHGLQPEIKFMPFHSIIRLFILFKYHLLKAEYEEQDFTDITIAFESIYFDYFFTEKKTHDVLNRIKSIFPEIFLRDCKICCNSSKLKQFLKPGRLK